MTAMVAALAKSWRRAETRQVMSRMTTSGLTNRSSSGGAGGGTVALPQLGAVAAVVGPEEQHTGHVRQIVHGGCRGAGPDVADEGGAGGGAVGFPQLDAVAAVIGREKQKTTHLGEGGRRGAQVRGVGAADGEGAARRRFPPLQLRQVRPRLPPRGSRSAHPLPPALQTADQKGTTPGTR